MVGSYPDLINTYQKASDIARVEHVPVIVHVKELTQPIGHSSLDHTKDINPKKD